MATIADILRITREENGLTAAELDYTLSIHGPAILGAAIYTAANAAHPLDDDARMTFAEAAQAIAERQARADALRAALAQQIDNAVAHAQAQPYTGWSEASHKPIQYAR